MMNNLRYADDTTLIAKDEEEIARMFERVGKIKLILRNRSNSVQLNNLLLNIETVNEFIHL